MQVLIEKCNTFYCTDRPGNSNKVPFGKIILLLNEILQVDFLVIMLFVDNNCKIFDFFETFYVIFLMKSSHIGGGIKHFKLRSIKVNADSIIVPFDPEFTKNSVLKSV